MADFTTSGIVTITPRLVDSLIAEVEEFRTAHCPESKQPIEDLEGLAKLIVTMAGGPLSDDDSGIVCIDSVQRVSILAGVRRPAEAWPAFVRVLGRCGAEGAFYYEDTEGRRTRELLSDEAAAQ